ncbi:MAG: hypothetical protein ACTSYD_09500 [Candidatus Heimdallarchaeaceae archaeon]
MKYTYSHIIGFSILLLVLSSTLVTNVWAQSYPIQVYNGELSSTRIIRGTKVDIYATIVNLGDKDFAVISLNAEFKHIENLTRFDKTYSVAFDYDHRTLKPNESLTGTLKAEITNPEATYNVSIYFRAEDVYNTSNPIGEAAYRDFYVASNITVQVIDYAEISNVVFGVGVAFSIGVALVVLFLIYSWLKDKIKSRKYK